LIEGVFTYFGRFKRKLIMKRKNTAILLALILGCLGAHKFYLGRTGQGILYVLFSWTAIPMIVGWAEAIIYFTTPDDDWDIRWNKGASSHPRDVTDELSKLHDLLGKGAITQEDYDRKKAQLLA